MLNDQDGDTHVAFHKSIDAVMNAVHSVTTVDTVPDEGSHGSIHPAGRRPNVHHTQVEAALTNIGKVSTRITHTLAWHLSHPQHLYINKGKENQLINKDD